MFLKEAWKLNKNIYNLQVDGDTSNKILTLVCHSLNSINNYLQSHLPI
jgi:hypothetical protein